jgi:hypothetical protein
MGLGAPAGAALRTQKGYRQAVPRPAIRPTQLRGGYVKRSVLVLIVIVVSLVASSPLLAQQARHPSESALSATFLPPRSVTLLASVPDSIRRKTGYQHWKGGAIGLGVGALGGLVLALAAPTECYDCTLDSAPAGKVTLIGAGQGGAFGFLVGLATPRDRWVPAAAESYGRAPMTPGA